jgi:hypothetical protein
MAPKAREIDLSAVRERLTRGESRRDIARSLEMPESTLRHHLNKGTPNVHVGILSTPLEKSIVSPEGVHEGDEGTPPLYVHPGIPDASTEESMPLAEGIMDVPQNIPSIPLEGGPQACGGIPQASLSPQLVEALTLAWPDLQSLLAWWQERQRQIETPGEKLERATYHVAPRWIEAVKREADKTGDTYAMVVNRAFRQYFTGRNT